MSLKKYVKLLTPPILIKLLQRVIHTSPVKEKITTSPVRVGSYSQYGEDLLIDGIFQGKQTGFYVDVGAYDPEFQSNTQRFYKRGWNGINIEPMVPNYNKFLNSRPRDINVNCGVHLLASELTFYELEWGTLSSFDRERAMASAKAFKVKIVKEYKVPVRTLSEILRENLPRDQSIDFMSVDTEGNEMNVLKGNDWQKYRPKIIVIEPAEDRELVNAYLIQKNYELVFQNHLNSIYQDTQAPDRLMS